jgi:hypothetical protein
MDLVDTANQIADLAEREVAPYVGPPIARQVSEVLEARKVRNRMFHMNLTHPGWSFLLDLYRGRLDPEGEPVELIGVRANVPVARLSSLAMIKVNGETARLPISAPG